MLAAHADENNTSFHLHSKVCSTAGFFIFSYKLHLQETNLFFILLKNCGCSFRFRMPTSWEQIVASLWFINVAERSFQEISGKDVVWFCFANDVLQWFANTISAPDGQWSLVFPDTSGVVFDTRSKMAMSQGGTAERMKEKVRRAHKRCCCLPGLNAHKKNIMGCSHSEHVSSEQEEQNIHSKLWRT